MSLTSTKTIQLMGTQHMVGSLCLLITMKLVSCSFYKKEKCIPWIPTHPNLVSMIRAHYWPNLQAEWHEIVTSGLKQPQLSHWATEKVCLPSQAITMSKTRSVSKKGNSCWIATWFFFHLSVIFSVILFCFVLFLASPPHSVVMYLLHLGPLLKRRPTYGRQV